MRMFNLSRYLGAFIDDQDSDKAWLAEKVTGLTKLGEVLDWVARQHPQTAYVNFPPLGLDPRVHVQSPGAGYHLPDIQED